MTTKVSSITLDGYNFERLRNNRKSRLQSKMAEYDADILLLFRPDNIRYATSHRPYYMFPDMTFMRNLAIFGRHGESFLLVDEGDYVRCKNLYVWFSKDQLIPIKGGFDREEAAKGLVVEIKKIFGQLGFKDARVAIDAATFNLSELIRKDIGATVIEANSLMASARVRKTFDEVVLIKHASQIASVGMRDGICYAKAGVTEGNVWAEICRTIYNEGGESAHSSGVVASGINSSYPSRLATDKLLESGDLVYLDVGSCYEGYFSDMARTIAIESPSTVQKSIYRTVVECKEAMANKLIPGNTTGDVATVGEEVIECSDFGEWGSIVGHGVGLGLSESPLVRVPYGSVRSDIRLIPGMVVAIEPAIWHPKGGVRLEDTYLITEGGNRSLTEMKLDDKLLS